MTASAGTSRLDTLGDIYFIQSGERPFVKIGYAVDVGARLVALQCGNPDELSLLGTVAGTLRDELAWHHRLASYAIRGEWFALSDEVRSSIADREAIALAIWQSRQPPQPASTGDAQFDRWRELIELGKRNRRLASARSTTLTPDMVATIRADRRSVRAIAAELGVSKTAVQDVRTGRTWSHIP